MEHFLTQRRHPGRRTPRVPWPAFFRCCDSRGLLLEPVPALPKQSPNLESRKPGEFEIDTGLGAGVHVEGACRTPFEGTRVTFFAVRLNAVRPNHAVDSGICAEKV